VSWEDEDKLPAISSSEPEVNHFREKRFLARKFEIHLVSRRHLGAAS
jgi:hypothetical protein